MDTIINSSIQSKIDGVSAFALKQIEDIRGAVLHMMRSDSPFFSKFGEIYFSIINPGAIKAWKRHKRNTQNITVPIGRIRLVLFDGRVECSSYGQFEEIILGRPEHYHLIRIPPRIWYGFDCVSNVPALIANCPDLPYDADELEQISISNNLITYNWRARLASAA